MRFTLLDMLLATAVVATSLGVFGGCGLVFALIVLVIFSFVRAAWSRSWAPGGVSVAIIVCLCLLALLVPDLLTAPRGPHRQSDCANQLKQIGVALHNYHDEYGRFPPAYLADAAGEPMHSWRVLLLRYMERPYLYEQYDFAEPWDGPNNSKLSGEVLRCYTCPSSLTAETLPVTSYLAVTGPNTAWSGARSIRLDDIRDGPHNTIILVEAVDSDINWAQPRDLTLQQVLCGVNPESGGGASCPHWNEGGFFYHDERGANVLMADGRTHFLRQGTSPEMLRALLSIDGGEDVEINDVCIGPPSSLHWPRCLSLAAWVVSVVLLLARGWVKV